MYAFKDGIDTVNSTNMNQLLSIQDFTNLFEGSWFDSYTGGVTDSAALSSYEYAVRVTTTSCHFTRVEFEARIDGNGEDLTVSLMSSGFDPVAGLEGTALATFVIPKEFIGASAAYISIPINYSGLTASTYYYLKIAKAGDGTNHAHIKGSNSTSGLASQPVYQRSAGSGAWSASTGNINFHAVSGISGALYHTIYGDNGIITNSYSAGKVSRIYFYLPPSDGADGGIRQYVDITWSGAYVSYGTVVG